MDLEPKTPRSGDCTNAKKTKKTAHKCKKRNFNSATKPQILAKRVRFSEFPELILLDCNFSYATEGEEIDIEEMQKKAAAKVDLLWGQENWDYLLWTNQILRKDAEDDENRATPLSLSTASSSDIPTDCLFN